MLRAVEWRNDHIEVIDQTVLPERLEVLHLHRVDEVVAAIRRLVVRGAPAIGVCGAFGVVLALDEGLELEEAAGRLRVARPTARNLAWAVDRVVDACDGSRHLALAEAQRIAQEDEESCRRIGEAGRAELTGVSRMLTHCNTGRLATAGIGTALAVAYSKAEAGEHIEVVATETRPLLQGGRLTAWELNDAGIPVTLVADSAAASALASGRVEAVVVGCDRVARNGDVANKVGTYPLAVLAQRHGVPFYVAGPMSTFDPQAPDGSSIEVELRAADEILCVGEKVVAAEVAAWNPAFDITPAELVTAFITDDGVIRPPYDFGS
jgi:methylthioribose-1-phosphate isomerase